MKVRLYDIRTDGTRDVTQRDVDEMQAVVTAYGLLRDAVTRVHTDLQARVGEIKERYELNPAVQAAMESTDAETQEGAPPA